MSSSLECPFCNREMRFNNNGPTLSDYSCQNEVCWLHKMPRYSRTDIDGTLGIERIVLSDDIYILIEHYLGQTTIFKLNIVIIDDGVIIQHPLKLDLKNLPRTLDKVKTLLLFS